MAAKKSNTAAVLVVVAIAAGAWFFLSHRKKPGAGGSGGGGFLGPSGGMGGYAGGVPGGGGASSVPTGSLQLPSLPNTLAARIKALLRFVSSGNQQGALLQSSNQYLPGLGTAADLSIPLQPMQLFDVGQLAQPIPLFDTSSISPSDVSLSDQSIPYNYFDTGGIDPNSFLQTQDIQSGSSYDPMNDPTQVIPTDVSGSISIDPYQLYGFSQPTILAGAGDQPSYGYS